MNHLDLVKRIAEAARQGEQEAWTKFVAAENTPREQDARLLWALMDARAGQMDLTVRMLEAEERRVSLDAVFAAEAAAKASRP